MTLSSGTIAARASGLRGHCPVFKENAASGAQWMRGATVTC
jgi:hypothetical protein